MPGTSATPGVPPSTWLDPLLIVPCDSDAWSPTAGGLLLFGPPFTLSMHLPWESTSESRLLPTSVC